MSALVLCAEMQKIADKKDASDIADAYKIVPLLEFVHTASLIHDDIEDGAQERRGLSCAHIAFGLDTAINAGSWLYFEAAAVIENIKDDNLKLRLYRLFAEELRCLHLGQAMDIAWHRDTKKNPDNRRIKPLCDWNCAEDDEFEKKWRIQNVNFKVQYKRRQN